jgi:hypothetical protein
MGYDKILFDKLVLSFLIIEVYPGYVPAFHLAGSVCSD